MLDVGQRIGWNRFAARLQLDERTIFRLVSGARCQRAPVQLVRIAMERGV